jgi:hypothetical protein
MLKCIKLTQLEKYDVFDTATRRLQEEMKDFMALNPTQQILEILLDYLHNDKEVQQSVAYVQSEKFPKIHRAVEYLKKYQKVSTFLYMNLNPEFDRKIICLFSTCE